MLGVFILVSGMSVKSTVC